MIMQKELLYALKKGRMAYEEKIVDAISEAVYQHKRYGINFSLALGASSASSSEVKQFSQMLRESDQFIELDEYFSCVLFTFVDIEQGIKAASKMLSAFEMQFFSEEIYVSVLNAKECETIHEHITKLLNILEHAITHGIKNIPLDGINLEH